MKIVLEKVKIYGFDPESFKTFTNNGKESKQYSVALYISQEQRNLIDSYIYGKCELTKDNEIVFSGKSKQPIPLFDPEKKKIEKAINKVFIADVSILIDEFTNKDGETIRYSKCLGIKFISLVENEEPRIIAKNSYETYDQIFGESEKDNKNELSANIPKDDISQMFETKETDPITETFGEAEQIDDLPF
jgi:hypothetical protein